MRVRNMVNGNIVWFGSAGKVGNSKIPANNFADGSNYVTVSLTQKLSLIKGELWYDTSIGLPLIDKVRSKAVYDKNVLSIIVNNAGVKKITSYSSSVVGHKYSFKFTVLTNNNDTIELNS